MTARGFDPRFSLKEVFPITLGYLKRNFRICGIALSSHARARIATVVALTVVCANSHRPRLLIFAATVLSLATCAHPGRDRWAVEAIALLRSALSFAFVA